ncbi:uncharacterized protein VDAG_03310 [Verticillium dahliae VdLs.17]|uniref:DUF1765-domain-containing protein n=1 Tax=Verticillium dahliae (strain VdLs.17 / ATCC MYA-4575 / FGSC 10137) TaxID=498257 RepID=G2WZ68_VERDV|nr:uncharacterized protein VDAG_03310 [Verticillium dahliae VdLs.17]EGY21870.1 hypothetical protein VDAG_03310 [Verticillium dahliae VdLs.17]
MAPAVGFDTSSFGRSHSSPDIMTPSAMPGQHQRGGGPKSLPSLPSFEIPSFDSTPDFDSRLYLDERTVAPTQILNEKKAAAVNVEAVRTPNDEKPKMLRRYSLVERPKSWLPGSKSATSIRDYLSDRPSTSVGEDASGSGLAAPAPSAPEPPNAGADRSARKRTDSFASFARKGWMSSSRPPSPQPRHEKVASLGGMSRDKASKSTSAIAATATKPATKQPAVHVADAETRRPADTTKGTTRALTRAGSYLTSKMKARPNSMLFQLGNNNDSDSTSCASSATSLAPPTTTFTIEHQGTFKTVSFAEGSITSTDESSNEMVPHRDPLWSAFKNLDIEFGKFHARTATQRMLLIRTTLVVFLRTYNNHASNKSLYPEDVEFRMTVLDRWWKGMLDMLDARDQQPLPGVDRPILLDAILMIMMRPEWRLVTTYMMPLADRSPAERVRSRSWTQSTDSSLASSQAEFLAESAEHNVRTMFVSNLLTQMAIVVDKMSVRHAPLSLVSFCGKACAYAFFFAPGAADMMTRLWGLTPDLVRRTADEFGLPKTNNGESDDIVALFPPSLGYLGWTDVRTVTTRLKGVPKLSLAAARIPWFSPWMSRWRGRDTDLFYIFCKHFHILSEEFMPQGLPLLEKARSPGFVMVQAQLLSNIDSTIHRSATADNMGIPPLYDVAYGMDANVMALGAAPTGNLLKGMSENRFIVLLRDFLSEDSFDFAPSRHTFAEASMAVLRAATKRTSLFDHNSCFTLCDFLEEALLAYDHFEDADDPNLEYVDWPFWFDVCKKMLGSHNAMTEIRLLSFIFTTWDAVTADPRRKQAVCLGWLLTEKTFNKLFNHWCPMVRAYFMRLLCWRICRDAGSANEIDAKIFMVVAARLKTTWSHYLYLKQTAEQSGKLPPSTAPCLPTPGKKFMIIRTELNTPQPGLGLGFDSFAKLNMNGSGQVNSGLIDSGNGGGKSEKKRWSLLGKVLSMTATSAGSPTGSAVSSPKRNNSWEDNFEQARKDLAAARTTPRPTTSPAGPPPPPKPTANGPSASNSSDGSSTGSSPLFQEQQYVFKFILGLHIYQPNQPRERILVRPRLPAPAQAWVTTRSRSGSSPRLPAARMPAPTRKVSGLKEGGLVSGARNASPLSSPLWPEASPRRISNEPAPQLSFSASFTQSLSEPLDRTAVEAMASEGLTAGGDDADADDIPLGESLTQPVKPVGFYASTGIYTGRSLAEWGVIVAECNGFIDRRRDEGVLGLSEVEVPTLGVEGFRRIG